MKRINLFLVNTLDDNKIGFVDFEGNHGEVYIAAPFGSDWSSIGYVDKDDSGEYLCRVISKRSFLSTISTGRYTVVDHDGYIGREGEGFSSPETAIARVCDHSLLGDPLNNSVYNRIGYADCEGRCEKWQLFGALTALRAIIYKHYFMEKAADGSTIIHSAYSEEERYRARVVDTFDCNKGYPAVLEKTPIVTGATCGMASGVAAAIAWYNISSIFDFSMTIKPFIFITAILVVAMTIIGSFSSKNYLLSKQYARITNIFAKLYSAAIGFIIAAVVSFLALGILDIIIDDKLVASGINPNILFPAAIQVIAIFVGVIKYFKRRKKEYYITRGW